MKGKNALNRSLFVVITIYVPKCSLGSHCLIISNSFYAIEATLRYGAYGITQIFSETAALPLVLWPT